MHTFFKNLKSVKRCCLVKNPVFNPDLSHSSHPSKHSHFRHDVDVTDGKELSEQTFQQQTSCRMTRAQKVSFCSICIQGYFFFMLQV